MRIRQRFLSPIIALLAVAVYSVGLAALPDIYPAPDQARADLAAALHTATATHRRVIVDFGGNWCPDCYVLDAYFHDAVNQPILAAHYVVVHVNIGLYDKNLDIAERYRVPWKKGVPALAVLESDGRLLYSQKSGEFEAMRRMQTSDVTQFLKQWIGTP